MNHSNHRGWFTWYDLMTSNMKGAEEFYPKVTGWSVENWRGGPMPYQLWRVGEVAVGGSMELPEEARAMGEPSQWRAHVGVADVDGVCRRVEELRGRVVRQPQNIPQVGRFAHQNDENDVRDHELVENPVLFGLGQPIEIRQSPETAVLEEVEGRSSCSPGG